MSSLAIVPDSMQRMQSEVDDDGDDFEVIECEPTDVSHSMSIISDEHVPELSPPEPELQPEIEPELETAAEQDVFHEASPILDASIAASLIQETRALRMDIDLKREEHEIEVEKARNEKIEAENKINQLESELTQVNRELSAANEDKQELALNLDEFEKCKDERDEFLARNLAKDEELNYFKKYIQQLQDEGGFINVKHPDSMLAKELHDSQNLIENEKKNRQSLEHELCDMRQSMDTVLSDNIELKDKVNMQQMQLEEFLKDIDALKSRNITLLQIVNKEQIHSIPVEGQASSENATIQQGEECYDCDQCMLRIPSRPLFEAHRQRCNAFHNQAN